MSSEWEKTQLGKALTFANGKTSPQRNIMGRYPVFGSNGIIGYSNENNVGEHSIIIGRVGSYCGSVYFSPKKCWVTDNAIYATPIGENNPKYLFFLLESLNLNRWHTGSGQPLLNQTILKSISVNLPTPKIQSKIAEILSSLDDKIELNRQMCQTLEAIASTLFKSWFVDFDPVKAKAAGRQPEGLSREIAALFPDSFVDSPLGKIPKGWKVSSIYELIDIIYGAPYKSELFNKEQRGLPVIRIRDLKTGKPQNFTEEQHPREVKIHPGDVLAGMDAEFMVGGEKSEK